MNESKVKISRTDEGRPLFCLLISLLLLFLPCSVVNSIQKQLELPISEKSSPSKSTVHAHSSCSLSDLIEISIVPKSPSVQLENGNGLLPTTIRVQVRRSSRLSFPSVFKNLISHKVPLYILYQQIRAHL
jgi:hypothetical protein